MSSNYAKLLKSVGLSLAIVASLSACQNEPDAPAVQPVDAAPDTAAVQPAAPPALVGTIPSVSPTNNERTAITVTSCNIELANSLSMDGEVPTVSGAADISLVGWFVDDVAKNIGDPLILKISNFDQSQYWDVPVLHRTERQDIVGAFKNNAALANAGFDVVLNLSQFPAGRYNVYLSHTVGANDLLCGQGRSISVE